RWRDIHHTEARRILARLEGLQAVEHEGRKQDSGRTVHFFKVTDKGRQLLDQFLARSKVTAKPTPESEDDSDIAWPRRDPNEVVREAVKTQPISVFDMA